MTVAPHLVLDGAIGIAKALRAPLVIVAVHDSVAATAIRAAAVVRKRDDIEVRVHESQGRFVAGEARAVLRGLEGDKAVPPGRRTLPSRKGYQGRPTFLSNVETFAQIAVLARLGSREYARTGARGGARHAATHDRGRRRTTRRDRGANRRTARHDSGTRRDRGRLRPIGRGVTATASAQPCSPARSRWTSGATPSYRAARSPRPTYRMPAEPPWPARLSPCVLDQLAGNQKARTKIKA